MILYLLLAATENIAAIDMSQPQTNSNETIEVTEQLTVSTTESASAPATKPTVPPTQSASAPTIRPAGTGYDDTEDDGMISRRCEYV